MHGSADREETHAPSAGNPRTKLGQGPWGTNRVPPRAQTGRVPWHRRSRRTGEAPPTTQQVLLQYREHRCITQCRPQGLKSRRRWPGLPTLRRQQTTRMMTKPGANGARRSSLQNRRRCPKPVRRRHEPALGVAHSRPRPGAPRRAAAPEETPVPGVPVLGGERTAGADPRGRGDSGQFRE